ncbi:MAG: hypothetical protein VYC11_06515 [Candidatus Thermoplasmatota archaeon]|nr:hypothetical protein [Euryarchaeota archaeon]MEC7704518.1 hypothetical protein [Candidatus Thermoplasmatota archaeon]MEC9091001.1 hypothetical protein [Candidatus Thermoplasmatota archaeon]MED5487172.1 hypothetical protein [Candidatus Thermoplasmatota archaeon]|tara:strand:+ start:2322 stop:3011 length:690 start_codon:yes stop_codon:yes gene_type:complete
MAKRGGFGKFLGGLAGRPYDRLMSRLEKIAKEHSGSSLASECEKFVKIVRRTLDEEQIDEEEHDLIMEEIEEIHPEGKTYPRLGDDSEDFYDGEELPDAPELDLGRRSNLDDLMKTKDGSFTGSFGRDEYEEYRQRMAQDFFKESDEAIASGDHQNMTSQDPGHRVFHDVEDEAKDLKRQIAQEMGVEVEEEEDDTYRVDEDGTEWWQDDDGAWWYRPQGEEDWYPYED